MKKILLLLVILISFSLQVAAQEEEFNIDRLDYYNKTIREKEALEKKLRENQISQTELNRLSQINVRSQGQIQNLRAGAAIKNREIKALTGNIEQLRKELREAKKNKDKNERLIRQLNVELTEATENLKSLKAELKKIKLINRELEGTIARYRIQLAQRDEKIFQQELEIFNLWTASEYNRDIAHLHYNCYTYDTKKSNSQLVIDTESNYLLKKSKLKRYGSKFGLMYIPSFYETDLRTVNFTCVIYRGNRLVFRDDKTVRVSSKTKRPSSSAKFASYDALREYQVKTAYTGGILVSPERSKNVFRSKGNFTFYIFANDQVLKFGSFVVK